MTPQQEAKRIERKLRNVPVEAIAPIVLSWEPAGMWCIVCGGLSFVPPDDGVWDVSTMWDAMTTFQVVRYIQAHPERVHSSWESARAFVRARFGVIPDAEPETPIHRTSDG